MLTLSRLFVAAALVLLLAPSSRAQSTTDAAGHWEGSIDVQGTSLGFEVDLSRNTHGELEGTIGIPSQHLRGIRLLNVSLEGQSVRFHARRDQPFGGTLSADGQSISGDYSVEGFSAPFSMRRVGDARIAAPLTSPAVSAALQGTWNAVLEASGVSMRVILTLQNLPDGTSIGRLVNLDEGGLELPLAIVEDKTQVTLDGGVGVGGFSGVLNPAAHELTGTWTQGPVSLPMTFRRTSDR